MIALLLALAVKTIFATEATGSDSTDVDELKHNIQTLNDGLFSLETDLHKLTRDFRSLKAAVIVLGVIYGFVLLCMFYEFLGATLHRCYDPSSHSSHQDAPKSSSAL